MAIEERIGVMDRVTAESKPIMVDVSGGGKKAANPILETLGNTPAATGERPSLESIMNAGG